MNYDRVILELLDRVSALEETVAQLKANGKNNANDIGAAHRIESGYEQKGDLPVSLSGKDTTKYIFEGKQYGKNRLVLAVIQKYVSTTPGISAEKLIATFDKSIQGSFGVVRLAKEVKVKIPFQKTHTVVFLCYTDEGLEVRAMVRTPAQFVIIRFMKGGTP